MKVTVTIGKKDYVVEIAPASHEVVPKSITLDGVPVAIECLGAEWLESFPRALRIDGQAYEVTFAQSEEGFPKTAYVDGRPIDLKVDFPGKGSLSKKKTFGMSGGASGDAIAAPMPGKIIGLKVKEGQQVEQGVCCVVLEAMKMENELPAPKSGKIKRVLVNEGDSVDLDQLLVVFES